MASDSPVILFDDIFVVSRLNPEGKKFAKVNRLVCRAQTFEADLSLDVASEFFPVNEGEQFSMALARTLRFDGAPEDDTYDQSGKETLLDRYDYGMHGKVFRYEHVSANQVAILASFGGLLMLLQGDPRHFTHLEMDSRIYCLLRKSRPRMQQQDCFGAYNLHARQPD